MKNLQDIEKILSELSDEELCGQMLCYDVYNTDNPVEVEKILKEIKPGGLFLCGMNEVQIKEYTAMANKYSRIPVVVAADIESGLGNAIAGKETMPNPMAWGAADSPELIEEAGERIAISCRKAGIQWTFSPVVDININKDNPVVNIRAVSDSPEQIIKIAGAYLKGLKKGGMAVTLKHFPGDGVDDRNQHFCTTENKLSMDDWRKTFGNVYGDLIALGADAVMAGHIALPSYDTEVKTEFGARPSIFSKPILTDLLRKEMKFDGVIVSDAMSMIGASAMCPLDQIAVRFVQSGGNMILFPEPTDHACLLKALNNGDISKNTIVESARKILTLKNNLKLFDNQEEYVKSLPEEKSIKDIAETIAERSIKFVRNANGLLPLTLKPNAKILMLNEYSYYDKTKTQCDEFILLKEELEKRGFDVLSIDNAKHKKVNAIKDEFDAILINFKFSQADYHGGSLRIGWDNIMVLWRAYSLNHKNVVFTSFGDPYKLYEFPYLKTYVNTFSNSKETVNAFVKVVLGEIPMTAKNPVRLEGFFERETD